MSNQTIHVRVDGRSTEFPFALLDIAQDASDVLIRQAVAEHLQLPQTSLLHHVVVHESQTIIVRPEAVYG